MTGKGNRTGRGPRIGGTIAGDMEPCWLCGASVASRALFCHACGAVQPPRALDAFTRLGVERRFDLDLERIDRQRDGLKRALDPQRFASRGPRQQALARAQADALDSAHETLHDPVRRARHLLELAGAGPAAPAAGDPAVEALRAGLAAAPDVRAVDRAANEVARRVEGCIRELGDAFRAGRTDAAALALARLESLEGLAAEARRRRAGLSPPA